MIKFTTATWTTSSTATLEIIAPNGKVYVSAGECVLEGVVIQGKIDVLHCKKVVMIGEIFES